jgi:hypothetical protein
MTFTTTFVMAEFCSRICGSISATANRNRADHAADSAKTVRLPSRSTAPVTCASSCAESLFFSHARQSSCACLCSATRASVTPFVDCEMRLRSVFTETGARAESRELLTERLPIRGDSGLCRRGRLGILHSADRGKPDRKAGTQSHRSTARSYDSGVASTARGQ